MPAALLPSLKLDAVRRVQARMSRGTSLIAACKLERVPHTSFQRWAARLSSGGEQALKADYSACGRPRKFELNEEESKALRSLVLIRDSQTFAIEEFMRHPDCRPETREQIHTELLNAMREQRYPRWPVSIRRAAALTQEERAKFRGSKHFEALSFSPRKGLFFVDEQGRNVPLRPHTVWTMDDYSTNEPYYITNEDGSTRNIRQVFASMDVATDAWLSVEMIGREKDAYRAEDILRYILRTIDGHGTMPLYLMLERGRWESIGVHGLDLEKEIGPKFKGRTWGALDDLFGIQHGFTPRHKACLESSFNILQRALAHSGRSIGRYRGEFEAATREHLRVQAGRVHAAAAGFLSLEESREAHWQAMQRLNARGKHRAATGLVEVPNDLMAMWDAELDARPLPESERWRFLPIKRLCTVRGGHIEMSVAPYPRPFRFQINGTESALNLPTGFHVLAAFDPAMPALGAHICNGEAGTLNREAWPIGKPLGTAPDAQDAPQFDLRSGGYAGSNKQRANAAASTSFATINPHKRGLAVSARHDGQGNATITRTGARKAQDGLTGSGSGETGNREIRMPEVEAEAEAQTEATAARQSTPAAISTRRAPSASELAALEDAAHEQFAL